MINGINDLLRMNLQFFAADGGGGDGGKADDAQDDNGNDGDNPTDPKEPEIKKLELTQDELDALIAKCIERERKKYVDYDDIKTKVSEYEKQLEEKRLAELSEKERAEEIVKKAKEERDALEKQLSEFKTQVERERIQNEFIKVATSNNIAFIDDAYRLADLSAVKIDEDGKVVGVEDVVKALVLNINRSY